MISRRVGFEDELLEPLDVIQAIRDELSKPTTKDWIGRGVRVTVEKMDCTRNWRSHVSGTGVKLEGGLLKDDAGNHLFLCMQRRGGAQ